MYGFAKIKNAYKTLAYLTFNVIVLVVALNLILGAFLFAYDMMFRVDATVRSYRERFVDDNAYMRTPAGDVAAYLDEQDEMGSIGLQYEPWVQFRNPAFQGRLLNTDQRGFRETRAPAERPGDPLAVYVFGGSTTFGYGVPDDHTIPSYLQRVLEQQRPEQAILVKNYGQGYYYSSQALLVFLSLIKNGEVPSWAVFIDGGNDTSLLSVRRDEPVFTPAVKRLWARRGSLRSSLEGLPMARFANGVARRLADPQTVSIQSDWNRPILSDDHLNETEIEEIVEYVVTRYRSNLRIRRALCQELGVKCLFVWEPHPAYKYDRSLHKNFPFPGKVPEYFKRVYARMELTRDSDFLNLADLTQHSTRKVYVDEVHYNEPLNELIAARIADAMRGE